MFMGKVFGCPSKTKQLERTLNFFQIFGEKENGDECSIKFRSIGCTVVIHTPSSLYLCSCLKFPNPCQEK